MQLLASEPVTCGIVTQITLLPMLLVTLTEAHIIVKRECLLSVNPFVAPGIPWSLGYDADAICGQHWYYYY